VSLGGTLAGLAAAAALAALAAVLGVVPLGHVAPIAAAALVASLAESVAGARLPRVPGAVLNVALAVAGGLLGMLFARA
jgi:uncharacterized membrane protein